MKIIFAVLAFVAIAAAAPRPSYQNSYAPVAAYPVASYPIATYPASSYPVATYPTGDASAASAAAATSSGASVPLYNVNSYSIGPDYGLANIGYGANYGARY